MNWSDVGSSIIKYAPLAGAALSSPVGAAIGVGTIIANLFGVDAKPEKVLEAINANPEQAEERIKYEMANNLELQKLVLESIKERNRHDEQDKAVELQNVEGARKNSPNVNASPVDNKIKMLLVVGLMVFFLGALVLLAALHSSINEWVAVILGGVIGSLMTHIGSIINYYWGEAFSAKNKT